MNNEKYKLSLDKSNQIVEILKDRFNKNMNRHAGLEWSLIESKLTDEKLYSLYEMEKTGGKPDVVVYKDEYYFFDCALESPIERRSLCYDDEALESRKENKPKNSAIQMALDMGIEILTKEEYEYLQTLGSFDLKTSSWIKTPDYIRKLGGALFCDCRYNTVFTYHNGAESYYSSRGFRGSLIV